MPPPYCCGWFPHCTALVWEKQGFVTVTTCRHGDNKCFRSDDTTHTTNKERKKQGKKQGKKQKKGKPLVSLTVSNLNQALPL